MPYRAHWIVLLVVLAAWSVSACDVQSAEAESVASPARGLGFNPIAEAAIRPIQMAKRASEASRASISAGDPRLDPIGDAPDRLARARADGVTVVVDVPEPYTPPGCDGDASAAGGRV